MAIFFGTRARLQGEFSSPSGLQDPEIVRLTITTPREVRRLVYGVDSDLRRLSQGIYFYDLFLDFAGTVRYCWASGAAGEEGLDEGSFSVARPT